MVRGAEEAVDRELHNDGDRLQGHGRRPLLPSKSRHGGRNAAQYRKLVARYEVVVRVRAVRREVVPADDEAQVALPADERLDEHLRVWLLVLSGVSHELMPEDVHGVRVPAFTMCDQRDCSDEAECESDRPWKPERANCLKVSLFE